MSPTYFYDIKYISPLGGQMYEYSRSSRYIDFSAFYHEDMWSRGVLDDSSRALIEQYRTVPRHAMFRSPLGLEFDCGSKLPALFARLHPTDVDFNQTVFTAVSKLVDLDNTTMPVAPKDIYIEDVGIFPERATGLLRLLMRGSFAAIKQFADANGCVNTDIISSATDIIPFTTAGISFDWDGAAMTNFMFHSATIHTDDPWVADVTAHATEQMAKLFSNRKYHISSFVKVGLSPNIPADYMKAYFTVRFQP
jgi:hypothetical protein